MIDFSQLPGLVTGKHITCTKLQDGSGVILDIGSSQVLSLNAVGYFILEQVIAGGHEPDTIAETVCREFDVERDTAHRDVCRFLSELTAFIRGST